MDDGRDGPRGRDAEFTEFFHAAWPGLFRTALAIAGDRGHAEDAVQSAFAKAYASWPKIVGASQPEAYLRRMVVNEILGWRRRGWWQRERPGHTPDAGPAVASPEAGVIGRSSLWQAVQALPLKQRAVVVLRYYEDMSEARIAEVLGCSRGTVKSQASAALANLRRSSGSDLEERGADA